MNWKLWGRGLFAAVINSAATTGSTVLVDPTLLEGGKVFPIIGISAAVGALLYLKQHPLPEGESK